MENTIKILKKRAKVFKKLNGYRSEFDMAEDYELMIRVMDQFNMSNLSEKLLLWRLWDKRRSRSEMAKMDRMDFKVKMELFKKGYFGPLYGFTIAKKFLMTYFLPPSLKISLAKMFKLA